MRRVIAITFLANLFLGQLSTMPIAFAVPTDDVATADFTACDEEKGQMSHIRHSERMPCPTDHCFDMSAPGEPDVASTGRTSPTEKCSPPLVASWTLASINEDSQYNDNPAPAIPITDTIVLRV